MSGRRKKKSRTRRWPKRLAIAAAVLALVPVVVSVMLNVVNPPVTAMMVWRGLQGQERRWEWRPLDDISPHLVAAVVAAEDSRFCGHWGVDWDQVQKVIADAGARGEKPKRGASTISMQVAKNLYLWPSRSVIRKGLEMPLALWLDLVLSKRRVLEIYLNIAEWAPGVYGAGAAARHHFGRRADRLTRRQAALLAATLPAPFRRKPARPSGALSTLAGVYQKRMNAIGPYVGCLDAD